MSRGFNFGNLLDFAIPIAMSFIPGMQPLAIAAASGGISALRTGSLQKGLMSGLMAGGLGAGLGSLGEAGAGAAGATAGSVAGGTGGALGEFAGVDEAIQSATERGLEDEYGNALLNKTAQPTSQEVSSKLADPTSGKWDRFKAALSSNDGGASIQKAFFPKDGGYTSPGALAGIGGLGIGMRQSYDASLDMQRQRADEIKARRMAYAQPGTPALPVTPLPPYNYEDPYLSATQGRRTPFFAGGGSVDADRHFEALKKNDKRKYDDTAPRKKPVDEGLRNPIYTPDELSEEAPTFMKPIYEPGPKERKVISMAQGGFLSDAMYGGGLNHLLNNNMIYPKQYDFLKKLTDPLNLGLTDKLGNQDDSDVMQQLGMPKFAEGGLAALPGAQRDIQHRRSGAAMLRRVYPDRGSALQDMHNPDSPIAKMGIQNPSDPLLHAAFPDEEGGIGRMVVGPGDGKSDSIPAIIDGHQPAALSSGEFVVPADAVAALGKGSNEAGARKLQMMVNKVKPKSRYRNA